MTFETDLYFVKSVLKKEIMTDIEKIIDEQIESYYKLAQTQNIPVWLTLRQRLSWNLYRLTAIYENELKDYAQAKINNKSKYLRSYLSKKAEKIQDRQITNALADIYAKDESLTEVTQEIFAEARREALKMKIDAVKEILSAISQIIANLRSEQDTTNK